jgi:hypothetical protein
MDRSWHFPDLPKRPDYVSSSRQSRFRNCARRSPRVTPLRHQPRGNLGTAKALCIRRNGAAGHLGYCEGRLSVFRCIFAGDLVDLLPSQLLWRDPGRIAGVAEKAIQASRRHDPEQEQFVIGIGEPMPSIPGNEYRSALLERVSCIVQCENSAAFQNVEGFVHQQVSVDRNTRTDRHLLSPQGKTVRARGRADLDEDIADVAKMNEMFAFGGAKYISL